MTIISSAHAASAPLPGSASSAQAPASTAGGFEDLLAAMLREAGDFLGRGNAESELDAIGAREVAELFNELGFFPGQSPDAKCEVGAALAPCAPPDTAQPGTPGRTGAVGEAGAPAQLSEPSVALVEPRDENGLTSVAARPDAVARAPGPGAAAHIPKPRTSVPATARAPQPPPAAFAQPGAPDEAPAGARQGAAVSRPPRDRTAPGAAADVQLTLATASAEVSLAARLQALSRDERVRLRTEIIQLLVRHGFGAGSLSINGESGRFGPQGGK